MSDLLTPDPVDPANDPTCTSCGHKRHSHGDEGGCYVCEEGVCPVFSSATPTPRKVEIEPGYPPRPMPRPGRGVSPEYARGFVAGREAMRPFLNDVYETLRIAERDTRDAGLRFPVPPDPAEPTSVLHEDGSEHERWQPCTLPVDHRHRCRVIEPVPPDPGTAATISEQSLGEALHWRHPDHAGKPGWGICDCMAVARSIAADYRHATLREPSRG